MAGRVAASTMKIAATKKKLRTGFYFLKDQAGHQTARPLTITELVKETNQILGQIGIEIVAQSYGYQTVNEDLGPSIRFSKSEKLADGRSLSNHYYQTLFNIRKANPEPFSVFFVWDFESPLPGIIASAFTWPKGKESICVFKDNIPNPGRNLAHEAGHALSVYSDSIDPTHLMYEYDMPTTGTAIPSDEAAEMQSSSLLE